MNRSLSIKNCESFSVSKKSVKKSSSFYCWVFNPRIAFLSLCAVMVISSGAYIFQINQLATMGQEINKKEDLLEKLKESNKSLEIKVAQLKSSYQFEEERERLSLINPDQVSFIEIEKNDSVAMIEQGDRLE